MNFDWQWFLKLFKQMRLFLINERKFNFPQIYAASFSKVDLFSPVNKFVNQNMSTIFN